VDGELDETFGVWREDIEAVVEVEDLLVSAL